MLTSPLFFFRHTVFASTNECKTQRAFREGLSETMWHPCVIHVSSLIIDLCHRGATIKQQGLCPRTCVSSSQVVKYWRNFVKPHSSSCRTMRCPPALACRTQIQKKRTVNRTKKGTFLCFSTANRPMFFQKMWISCEKRLIHRGEITTKLESWMWHWADKIDKIKQLLCRWNTKISHCRCSRDEV